jgi:hypothetical protein
MKKLNMFLLFILCVTGIFIFMPKDVQAANTTRTLQPGRVYTFTGLDRRVISHIAVAGTGRYQFVTLDGRGNVTGYGFAFGRVSVHGDGATLLSPLTPTNVTFDTARITMTETAGEALRQITLADGQTLAVTNNGRVNQHIRTNRAAPYDVVITNAVGNVTVLERGIRFPQFSLPLGGEAVITAAGDDMVVYYPNLWHGNTITTRRLNHPAIFSYDLWEGETYLLTNTGERNVMLWVEALFSAAAFSYDFIVRDRLGFAVSHGETTSNRITVQPHRPLTLTPHMDAELFFPYTMQRDFLIGFGTDAPAFYALEPGQTLQIANNSLTRFYNVFLASEPSGYGIVYDFTLETDEGITFGLERETGTVRIPPGGILTLTAGLPPEWAPQTLAVRFPDSDMISYKLTEPTITRFTVKTGESFLLNLNGDRVFSCLVKSSADVTLDYVLSNPEGEIVSFGRKTQTIELEPGYTLHITNPNEDEPIDLYFPSAWLNDGLTLTATSAPALFRRVLEEGEALRIDNVSTRLNRPLLIENFSNTRTGTADFILTDTDNTIRSYGTQNMGLVTLRYESRLSLTPTGETRISVSYPAVWHNRFFRIFNAAAPLLYRVTLRPGEELELRNTSQSFITVSTNGEPIRVAPNATFTLEAPRGENLHIWMPITRARQLRLV